MAIRKRPDDFDTPVVPGCKGTRRRVVKSSPFDAKTKKQVAKCASKKTKPVAKCASTDKKPVAKCVSTDKKPVATSASTKKKQVAQPGKSGELIRKKTIGQPAADIRVKSEAVALAVKYEGGCDLDVFRSDPFFKESDEKLSLSLHCRKSRAYHRAYKYKREWLVQLGKTTSKCEYYAKLFAQKCAAQVRKEPALPGAEIREF